MQDPTVEKKTPGDNPLLQQGVIIPINLNWRKKYYRKVLWIRIMAFIIDFLIIFIGVDMFIFILFEKIFVKHNLADSSLTAEADLFSVAYFITCFFVNCVVGAFFDSSKWQGTPGKRIMKLQITGTDGYRLSFFRALLRNVCKAITIFFGFFAMPFLIYNGIVAKRFWHDRLSKTDIGMRVG